MSRQSSAKSRFAATVLIFVNVMAMVFCIILFGVGVWMIASPATLSSMVEKIRSPVIMTLLSRDSMSVLTGIALAGVAGFLFCVSFMGLYGAIGRSPFLLFMYAILNLLLLLLECALLYYFTSGLIEKGLQAGDGQWTHAVRLAFRCCEYNATIFPPSGRPPWSCCGNAGYPDNCTMEYVYRNNCHETISHWLSRYQTGLYTLLAVAHIVFSSCSLLRRARSVPSLSYS